MRCEVRCDHVTQGGVLEREEMRCYARGHEGVYVHIIIDDTRKHK